MCFQYWSLNSPSEAHPLNGKRTLWSKVKQIVCKKENRRKMKTKWKLTGTKCALHMQTHLSESIFHIPYYYISHSPTVYIFIGNIREISATPLTLLPKEWYECLNKMFSGFVCRLYFWCTFGSYDFYLFVIFSLHSFPFVFIVLMHCICDMNVSNEIMEIYANVHELQTATPSRLMKIKFIWQSIKNVRKPKCLQYIC